jgi:hypothetical protein
MSENGKPPAHRRMATRADHVYNPHTDQFGWGNIVSQTVIGLARMTSELNRYLS